MFLINIYLQLYSSLTKKLFQIPPGVAAFSSNPAISQLDKLGRLPKIFGRRPNISLKTVLSSPYQVLLKLESKFYSNPAISLLSQGWGRNQ